jgi:hypothetical protein
LKQDIDDFSFSYRSIRFIVRRLSLASDRCLDIKTYVDTQISHSRRFGSPELQFATYLCNGGNIYNITKEPSKGVGCFDVSGDHAEWLLVTRVVLGI